MKVIEPESKQDQLQEKKRRKQRHLERWILVTIVALIIIAVVATTIWIVVRQGIDQNTPAILSVVVTIVIGSPSKFLNSTEIGQPQLVLVYVIVQSRVILYELDSSIRPKVTATGEKEYTMSKQRKERVSLETLEADFDKRHMGSNA